MALTFRKLRIWNTGAFLLQLLAGVAILILSDGNERAKLPWYTFFVQSWGNDTPEEQAGFYVPLGKKVASFPVGIWCGAFLLLSAADHLLVILPGINAIYNRYACLNRNPFRWAEYAVSAGLMSVMIAQLCGVTDIHLLFAMFSLMASTQLFGWQMELSNGTALPCFAYTSDSRAPPALLRGKHDDGFPAPTGEVPSAFITDGTYEGSGVAGEAPRSHRVDWTPLVLGCWPFLAVQLITACYFFQAVAKGDPPTFVWSLFFILFVLYALFAVNMWLQFKQVRGWRGFAKAEWWYILLSLTSKQLLAWITYGGTKRLES
ncbi:hypothetical protein C2E20_7432 [Micractinium conductrix]|uniref:Uncharacterized protein n=1 Tax=Micractinium conductrix TaxID=554055 RepID=A0A2P6V4I5_9CHLO|nr:hypothetical protein C2E20_7432 [Micractinium conductrix]|eukprot:PSC68996.1 hypothetical protein C2E20_7432 [Micractinium conductrix]